jgi:ABC-2 type transport system ATP-binding protein
MPALSAQGLSKRYGTTEALSEISLQVTEGELIGLLGPNGAGKSTFAKIICGLVRPSRGSVEVFGERPGSRDASAAIGYLAELFRFPEWLSALEVLELHQQLADSSGGASERQELLASVGLAEEGDRRVATMSKGMQQRLGLAQALIGSPRLLLLDEPTSALDPAGRRTVRDLLARLRSGGTSILLSSHLLSEVELICDRVAILYRGKLVTEGVPAELTRGSGVEVETASGNRRFDDTGREQIPELVERLVAEGERIFAVREVSSTLEDFYIETVGGDEAE